MLKALEFTVIIAKCGELKRSICLASFPGPTHNGNLTHTLYLHDRHSQKIMSAKGVVIIWSVYVVMLECSVRHIMFPAYDVMISLDGKLNPPPPQCSSFVSRIHTVINYAIIFSCNMQTASCCAQIYARMWNVARTHMHTLCSLVWDMFRLVKAG